MLNIPNCIPDQVRYWWQNERWFQSIIYCRNHTKSDHRNCFKTGFKPRASVQTPCSETGCQGCPSPPPPCVPNRGCMCYLAEGKHCMGSDTAAMMRSGEGEKRGITIPTYTYFWLCTFVGVFKLFIAGPSTARTNQANSWTKPWYFWPMPAWEHPSLHPSVPWDPAKLSGKTWHFLFHVWVVQVAATLDIGLLVHNITERKCFDYIK